MMNQNSDEQLDQLVAALDHDVKPERDLWPEINQRIEQSRQRHTQPIWRVAAAVMLVIGSSLATAWYVQRETSTAVLVSAHEYPRGQQATLPNWTTSDVTLGQKYSDTRKILLSDFEARLSKLPPETQQAVVKNLVDIQLALEEINAALDTNPDNVLLQNLLVTTYEGELGVLADVNQVTLTRTDI